MGAVMKLSIRNLLAVGTVVLTMGATALTSAPAASALTLTQTQDPLPVEVITDGGYTVVIVWTPATTAAAVDPDIELELVEDTSSTCFGEPATITGTSSGETRDGTSGNDVIVLKGGADSSSAQGGIDRVCAGSGGDNVNGASGIDRLSGGSGGDTVRGGADNDPKIRGGSGSDDLYDGFGSDTILAQDGEVDNITVCKESGATDTVHADSNDHLFVNSAC